jgi:hypothetical protein
MSNYYKLKQQAYNYLTRIVSNTKGSDIDLVQLEEVFMVKFGFGQRIMLTMLKIFEKKGLVTISSNKETMSVLEHA